MLGQVLNRVMICTFIRSLSSPEPWSEASSLAPRTCGSRRSPEKCGRGQRRVDTRLLRRHNPVGHSRVAAFTPFFLRGGSRASIFRVSLVGASRGRSKGTAGRFCWELSLEVILGLKRNKTCLPKFKTLSIFNLFSLGS